jgi:Rab guanine nucleotide exchange factor SEC2
MVSNANKERDVTERKNKQLHDQMTEKDNLLISQQEQLAELKMVVQQLTEERAEIIGIGTNPTTPSTPDLANRMSRDSLGKNFDSLALSPHISGTEDVAPACPTSFTHLLHPVLRTDLQAYQDFKSLMKMSHGHKSQNSRNSSGGSFGLSALGLGISTHEHSPSVGHVMNSNMPANGSTSSLSTVTTAQTNSQPQTPTTPLSSTSIGSNGPPHLLSLKETRFYKRSLVEDIEPTLRLETAPGLSWLARRSVLSAMNEGRVDVEPTPSDTSAKLLACTLCGENRRDEAHARKHRFRINDTDAAQRYPLCAYCLDRFRATCDFLNFLRAVKDGNWRTNGEVGEKGAWEESVKLRERMFWARIGGGVIPKTHGQEIYQAPSEAKTSSDLDRIGEADSEKDEAEELQSKQSRQSEETPDTSVEENAEETLSPSDSEAKAEEQIKAELDAASKMPPPPIPAEALPTEESSDDITEKVHVEQVDENITPTEAPELEAHTDNLDVKKLRPESTQSLGSNSGLSSPRLSLSIPGSPQPVTSA